MLVLGSKLTLYVDSLCVTAIVPCVEVPMWGAWPRCLCGGPGLGAYVGGLGALLGISF